MHIITHRMTYYTRSVLAVIAVCAVTLIGAPTADAVHSNENIQEKKEYSTKEKTNTTYKKQDTSLLEVINLLIALDIIPQDRADEARAFLEKEGYTKTATSNTCPSTPFKYNLYLGMTDGGTNGEVSRLQTWLVTMPAIYPEGLITGYFGPATEQAVQRYQTKKGIVSSGAPETTGYGVVGPKTRKSIHACMPVSAIDKKDYTYNKNKEYDEKKKGEYKEADKNEKKDENSSDSVTAIELHTDEGNHKVWWETKGYAPKGFKVSWSHEPGPTYPTRNSDTYAYFSDPNTRHAKLEAFDGDGTYYVRVCEYLGGGCGVYSNEVTIEL